MPRFADVSTYAAGKARITFLADGGGRASPSASLPATTDADWQRYAAALDDQGRLVTSIGGFLIQTGGRVVVVDTGIGPVSLDFPGFGVYQGGRLLESLARAGTSPEAVTDVVFTHLHVDHVGWVTQPGDDGATRLTFPNARHLVARAEWDFWHGGDNPAGPDPERVQCPLEDRIAFIADGDAVAPGVVVIALPGHTPGHLGLSVVAGTTHIHLLGDLLYSPMQIAETGWNSAFDVDGDQARATREQTLADLAQTGHVAAFGHFADAVFGRVVRDGPALRWEAL